MKAVLFDVDDTLYNQADIFRDAYETVFGTRFTLDTEKLFTASRRRSDEVFEASQRGEMTMEAMYIYRIQKAFEDLGVAISDEEALLFQEKYAENQRNLKVPDKTAALLEACRAAGVTMGVITNGPSQHQWKKVHALGLEQWIPTEHIFVSGDCGAAKPDPAVFRYAQEKLGLEAADLIFVGDSYENDVIGAKNSGWSVIWVNRRGRKLAGGGILPDIVVNDETQMCRQVLELFGIC